MVLTRLGLVGAMMTALLMGAAGSASASSSYDLSHNPAGAGSISVAGTLTFKSKTSFTYDLKVYDYCGSGGDGDGYGAAARFGVNTLSLSYPTAWRPNTNGCGTVEHYTGTVTKSESITSVYAFLGRTSGGTITPVNQSSCKDNPYVTGNGC